MISVSQKLKEMHGAIHEMLVPIKGKAMSRRHLKDRAGDSYPIDFVVTWVDGNDSQWKAMRNQYAKMSSEEGNIEARFREWDIFNYWFRSVEKYAPWVHKVYLVTCGHTPEWLNKSCPKLVVVSHAEFMDSAYLPTFNSIPIELNLCNIEGLSEHFVYFNDDVFLTKPVFPEDFFEEGLPKYAAIAEPLAGYGVFAFFQHELFSNLCIINREFDVRKCIEAHPEKWFSYKYNRDLKLNKFAFKRSFLPGMHFTHLAVPYRKSTMNRVWMKITERLDWTCRHKFREPLDLNHQIFQLWEMCEGTFAPTEKDHYGGLPASISEDAITAIEQERYICVCLNDSEGISSEQFLRWKTICAEVFEKKFPQKSVFEK